MVQVGFEPTPPKRLELESSALDRSATEPPSYMYTLDFKLIKKTKTRKKSKARKKDDWCGVRTHAPEETGA